MERALITQFEKDMKTMLPLLNDQTRDAIEALVALPQQIRGFGPVKAQNAEKAAARRDELMTIIVAGGPDLARAAE